MTQDIPSRLDRLETLLADVGDVVLQNAEVTANHDATLTRIENNLEQLTIRLDQLTSRVDTLAAVTAQNNDRIEQILEYLFRERPNGRSGQ